MDIKIDGVDVVVSKLEVKSGDMIVLHGDISNEQARYFRKALYEVLPLDVHVLGVVVLESDHRIETISPKAGDVVILRGPVAMEQLNRLRTDLKSSIPGLIGVENVPSAVEVEVSTPKDLGIKAPEVEKSSEPCRKCKTVGSVTFSFRGDYDDCRYQCSYCDGVWWIDGTDA